MAACLPKGGHFRAEVGQKKRSGFFLVRENAVYCINRPQLSGDRRILAQRRPRQRIAPILARLLAEFIEVIS
jgi:hypothetical protein